MNATWYAHRYPSQKDLLLSTALQLAAVTVTFLRWSCALCPLTLDLPVKAANHKYAATGTPCPPLAPVNTVATAWLVKVIGDCTRAVLLSRGWFYLPGRIWQCLKTFLMITMGAGVAVGVATGIRWAEARDDAKHPILLNTIRSKQWKSDDETETKKSQRTAQNRSSTEKNYLAQIVPRLNYSELFFFITALWR